MTTVESSPESEICEWKSSWRDEYMKWLSAFAYNDGGTLRIGVNDDGYVIGLKDYRKLLEVLPNKFRDKLHITPTVRLRFVEKLGVNIRYSVVPEEISSKDCNKYACGLFLPTTEKQKEKHNKWRKEEPICQDADGKYYYIEIEVRHYNNLVTYNGVQYTRSGSTLQVLEGKDLEQAVLSIQNRNQNSYYVNRVFPKFSVADLREDLIDRARKMAIARKPDHEWKEMSDEEVLRLCGLILTDEVTGERGITLAAILLFGTDNLIMSVCYQHKTDAIVRIIDTDRYDDRDVIITNLLDSYDRLMEFGRRHLNDRFVLNETGDRLNGIQSISARDRILREIVSNILMHRDFSSDYIAKFLIERDHVIVTNANRPHGSGNLDINRFEPFQKNPAISKVFREIGLADELGSGMRNAYKYTKLYSGGEPVFTEDGDVFRIEIPLNEAATVNVGPMDTNASVSNMTEVMGVSIKLSKDRIEDTINFCTEARTTLELMDHLDMKSRDYFRTNILNPMIEAGLLRCTIPDKPKSPNQRYVKA